MPNPEPAAAAPANGGPANAGPIAAAPPGPTARPARSAAARAADHRAVEQLAGDLLPALIARLSGSGLAELEVREGGWKVRLRRPLELVGSGRRATDRQHRLPAGAAGPGMASGGHGGPGRATPGVGAAGDPYPGRSSGRDSSRADARGDGAADPAVRPTATSPGVGIFRPHAGIGGTEVRAGDRLGAVDVLGIPQEVVTPIDGVVGEILAEPGDGVEYGQALFAIESRGLVPAGLVIPVEAEEHVPAPAGDRS